MAQNNIINDLQSSSGESLVELFDLEVNEQVTLRFHAGVDETYQEVVFDGNTYTPLPIQLEGVEVLSDGPGTRPTLTLANVTVLFKTLLNDNNLRMDALIGLKLTRRRTFEKYLGDPEELFEFPKASYIIDRIAAETSLAVEFELASPFDVEGVKLPSRSIVGKYCSWIYQGKELKNCGGCSWAVDSTHHVGNKSNSIQSFFDIDDKPIITGIPNPTPPPDPAPQYWEYIIPQEGSWSIWSSTTTYSADSLVVFEGRYWRSEFSLNADNTPGQSGGYWQEVLLYTNEAWNSITNYEAGQYLKHEVDNIVAIWRATLPSIDQEPYFGSPYWTRADACSKTLGGCKSRFQFQTIGDTSIPSSNKNTLKPLPFGAFPGSVKFK